MPVKWRAITPSSGYYVSLLFPLNIKEGGFILKEKGENLPFAFIEIKQTYTDAQVYNQRYVKCVNGFT